MATLCAFLFVICGQPLFAAIDIHVYKDENGTLAFTTVPTHLEYTRLIRSEEKPQPKTQRAQVKGEDAVVQLVRNPETGDIGYLNGETFIPLWPESYITLTDVNTAFAAPNEYENIWVRGLSERVGPIKIRRGLPLRITVTAIDWLIERNLDKYKSKSTSRSNQLRTKLFIISFVIMLTSLLVIVATYCYKVRPAIPLAIYNSALSYRQQLTSLLIACFKEHYNTLARLSELVRVAISKYALGNCCRYCKEHTVNVTRICDECETRFRSEQSNATERERQERERRTRFDNNSERERTTDGEFDPYQVLRIKEGADKEEVKAAYFNLIKQYHPDRVSHLGQEFQKLAEEKAQLINRAYEVLMNGSKNKSDLWARG